MNTTSSQSGSDNELILKLRSENTKLKETNANLHVQIAKLSQSLEVKNIILKKKLSSEDVTPTITIK